VEQLAGTKRNKPFGFDHYVVPVEDLKIRPPWWGSSKDKRQIFTDMIAKEK
jgi:hypothetical protein